MKNIFKNLSIILLILLIIIKRPLIIAAVLEAINIWFTSVFPALFPFLVLSDYIVSSSLINEITNYLGPFFTKAFKVSKYAAYVFIMSLISGCPSNAKYIKDLLELRLINTKEASKILAMTLLYNPLLIITITSYLKPGDTYLIIILNIIINLIIGLFNRQIRCDYQNDYELVPTKFDLVKSLTKTINTLLMVLASLVFFITLSALISYEHPLIIGIFEITNGLSDINNIISYELKLIFTTILLSFGGLSIHTQIKSILADYKLEYSLFYKSRILHLIIFTLLIKLIV